MIVHQLLSGAGPVDAVTNQARAYRRLFREWGWGGEDFAGAIDPRVGDDFAPLSRARPGPDDLLLFHYSAYAPKLERFLELPQRKVLVSHNITPAHWFWDFEPVTAVQCTIGREQLPQFARAVDLAIGVSAYNAAELAEAGARATAVVPVLVDPTRLGEPGEPPPGPPHVLFVGRLTPHKRHDLLLRTLAVLRADRHPDARMTFVGEPLSPPFLSALRELATRLGVADAVAFESQLSAAELAARWRSARAFCCLSDHEGFCIPLLEAFHFGVPVVARSQGGVAEVCGDAAVLLSPADGPRVAAEALHLAVSGDALRSELRSRARARLAAFEFTRVARTLREALEGVVTR